MENCKGTNCANSEKTEHSEECIKQHEDCCKPKTEIEKAIDTLTEAMQDTELGSYAHSWHCNLAMCFMDELETSKSNDAHAICNDGASRFMKLLFNVETKNE